MMKKRRPDDAHNRLRQARVERTRRRDAQMRTYLTSSHAREVLREEYPRPLTKVTRDNPDPLVVVMARIRGAHGGIRAWVRRQADFVGTTS